MPPARSPDSTLRFLGAARTVTGSRHLLEYEGHRVLVDCGLFQGTKELRLRNWAPWPVDPRSVDAVVLTHAHVDHTGGLPGFVRRGFSGPVYCTPGTRDLSELLLPDSARLQEEEALYANARGYSKHRPALPLYGEADARAALDRLVPLAYEKDKEILPGIVLRLDRAGHILGSAICTFDLRASGQRVVFTGDLGRFHAPILKDPERVRRATTLVAEGTYGDRTHGDAAPLDALAAAVQGVVERGGVLVVPAFAVGRTQELLYHLGALERAGRIPTLPVFVDSPMACDATELYRRHTDEHDVFAKAVAAGGASPLATRRTEFVAEARHSKALNALQGPAVIISASGMATGGRVLHHLRHRLPSARNAVLFVGYQAAGTRGRRLLDGEKDLKVLGEYVPVRAEILSIAGFSAHADAGEILRWMDGFEAPPRQTLLVHGEPHSLEALCARIAARGWSVRVPAHLETVPLAVGSD